MAIVRLNPAPSLPVVQAKRRTIAAAKGNARWVRDSFNWDTPYKVTPLVSHESVSSQSTENIKVHTLNETTVTWDAFIPAQTAFTFDIIWYAIGYTD